MTKLEEAMAGTITGKQHVTTVQGITYIFYSDMIKRATIAYNTQTEELRAIRTSGYITNDLSARKMIAAVYGLKSFSK